MKNDNIRKIHALQIQWSFFENKKLWHPHIPWGGLIMFRLQAGQRQQVSNIEHPACGGRALQRKLKQKKCRVPQTIVVLLQVRRYALLWLGAIDHGPSFLMWGDGVLIQGAFLCYCMDGAGVGGGC